MPAIIKGLTKRGLVDLAPASSLDEAAKREPQDGVYTVSNTYDRTKTLLLDEHLNRLEDSAQRLGFTVEIDRRRLKAMLRQMIVESEFGDVRYRISIAAADPESMILSIEPYRPPSPQLNSNGARCVTSSEARRNPASKSSDWMHRRRALEAAKPAGIYETFLLDSSGCLFGRRFEQRLRCSRWRAAHGGARRLGRRLADDRD